MAGLRHGSHFSREEAGPYDAYAAGSYASAARRPRRGLVVALAVVGVLVVVLAFAGVTAFSLYQSYQRIQAQVADVTGDVAGFKDALVSGDAAALEAQVQTVSDAVHAIDDEVSGWGWGVASAMPVVGGDVRNARSLVGVAVDLVDNALAPVADAVKGVSLSSLVENGSLNVSIVRQLSDAVVSVAPVVSRSAQTVSRLPEARIAQVGELQAQVADALDKADYLADLAAKVLPYLPQMLGADGQTRTYLLIAQNNAELRATGGFPGAWGTIVVSDGHISLGEFTTLVGERDYVFDLTDEETALFGEGMAINPGGLNSTPDFSRAGQLFATAWEVYRGQKVDGVVAIDPVFLQDILGLTGGVTTADGTTVDGSNAAKILMSDAYWMFGDNIEESDLFFSHVAGLAADQIMGNLGSIDLSALLGVVMGAADEGRLIMWLSNADEEAAILSVGLAGVLSFDEAEPVLGVYVNDDTWAKMGWYLKLDTSVLSSRKNADGTVTYDMSTTLTNTITDEEAQVAPAYVTGVGENENEMRRFAGDMYMHLFLVAPAGGTLDGVTVSTGVQPRVGTLYGFAVEAADVNVGPRESVTVTYQVTVSSRAEEDLAVHQTPTAQEF